ncbi:carbonic anhydrase [Archangium gephyra]|uniref:carbonic anhydrase n=1 Tax=Archangium gephyra TaxID=48 RepID=UPI003B7CF42D
MQRLVRGVHKFQKEVVGKKADFFADLAKGQRPHTLFISCSDSRLSPNQLTQTEPGEIFILRNAGNIIPPHSATVGGEAATIEYAVGALGVTDIVVCGHTHCGAMTGLLHPETLAELPAFRTWLGHAEATRRIVAENYAQLPEAERLNVAIQENVLVQLEHLRTIPVVAAKLAGGRLHLHGWVYKIDTGEVFAYDPVESQFLALAKYQPKPSQPHSFTTLPSI